jgi:hypothetical protein
MTTPANTQAEEIILDLPELKDDRYPLAPAVTVSRGRITISTNAASQSHSLAGTTAVKFEMINRRLNQWKLWLGWALIILGVVLFPLFLFLGIPVFIVGVALASTTTDTQIDGRITLEQQGKRVVCYNEQLGSPNPSFWRKRGCPVGSDRSERMIRQFCLSRDRAKEVADAIGKAIGTPSSK